MPLGAARLNFLAKSVTVEAAAEVIRKQRNFFSVGDAQIDTSQSKFGGSSLYLDGSDYIEHTNSGLINTDNNGTVTIEMWVRPAATQAYNGLFDASPSATGGIREYGASGNLVAKVQQEASGASTGTWTAGTWTHFAVTFDNGTIKTYRDGTLEDTGSYTGGIEDKGAFIIGAINRGGAGYFTGHIDEFRISDNIRYTGSFTPSSTQFENDDNTKVLLHFDGLDGDKVFIDDNSAGKNLSFASDSYADNVELFVPFDAQYGINDLSQYINSTHSVGSVITSHGTNTARDATNVKWDNYAESVSFTQGDDAISYTLQTSIPSHASGTFVIEGWFRATATGTNWCLSSEDTGGRWIASIAGGTIGFSTSEGNQNFVNTGSTTDFVHVAFVCNAGTKTVYIGGTSYGSWGSSNTGQSKLSVGQFKTGDANDYDGNIQDLRVTIGSTRGYSGASITPPSAIISSVTAGSPKNNAQISTAQSKFGGSSALFDGTNDVVAIGDDSDSSYVLWPQTGEFTIEGWFRYDAAISSGTTVVAANVYGAYGDANPTGRSWIGLYQGKPTISINGGGFVQSATLATQSQWYHFAGVRDSSNEVRLYVDGTEVGTSFTSSQTIASGYVALGATGNTYDLDWNGYIDEFRISNTCRYTANFTAPTAPFQWDSNTVSLMHMDGTNGSTVFPTDFGIDTAGVG